MHDEDENFEGKIWYGQAGFIERRSRSEREHGARQEEGLVAFVALGCSMEDITYRLYDALLADHLYLTPDSDYQLGTREEAAAAMGPELTARMAQLSKADPVAFGPFRFN